MVFQVIPLAGLLRLTRFFRHKCCLRRTRVFTINMQGTQAKAMTTKSDCRAIYIFREEKEKPLRRTKTLLWFILWQKDGKSISDLSSVERLVTRVTVVEEEHVNKGDEEAGGVPGAACVIRDPLIEDQNDQVAKQTGHEDDFWDESQVDIQWLLEIPAENHEHSE